MPQKSAFRLLPFSSVSSWLLMVVGHVVFATKPANHAAYAGIHSSVPGLSESVFPLTTFFFFRYRARLKNYPEMKLVDILSDVLIIGCMALLMATIGQILVSSLPDRSKYGLPLTFFQYPIHTGLAAADESCAFFAWKYFSAGSSVSNRRCTATLYGWHCRSEKHTRRRIRIRPVIAFLHQES